MPIFTVTAPDGRTYDVNAPEGATQEQAFEYVRQNHYGGVDPEPKKTSRSAMDVVRDVGVTALKGAVALPEAIVGLADIPTGGRVGKALEDVGVRFGDTQKILGDQYSEAQQEANRKVQEADGFVDTTVAALENPSTIATAIGESIPQMIGGAGLARLGIKGAVKLGAKVSPWLAGAVGEGTIAAGSAAEGMRQESADKLLSGKQTVAALGSGAGTAALGALGGKLAQKFKFGDMDTILAQGGPDAVAAGAAKKGFMRQVAEGGISEGVFEEMPQSIQETMWQNWAGDKPLMEGTGNAAAMGMLAGLGMGMGGGGYNAAMNREDSTMAPSPEAAPTVEGGDPPTTTPPSGPLAGQDDGRSYNQAAQDTLTTPRNLTALDRVTEIDSEETRLKTREAELSAENGYGEMFDKDRQDIAARRAELYAEREAITKTWPASIPGKPVSFSTETGARLEGQYALMEADDLVASHDENLRPSPTYPPALQPRARDRAASEMQISGIVQKLDPARLGESADAATGAPIVGADGLVESGNARTIALKRAYQAKGLKADSYREFLRANADRFGLDAEAVTAMRRPVLVRVRSTPVDRAEFARQANASTVAQMSPSEQARADSARMDTLDDLTPDDNGDFTTGTSRDFVRRFLSKLPGTEQAGMIDATGQLSQSGYSRIRNAVLAKAYGDSPVLLRMVESLDDNTRNLSKALMQAAPTVAKSRQAIQEGVLFDADITPDLMSAVEELSRLKDDGASVRDALAQTGMFGERYSPETRELLQFLADNMRRPRKIAEFIQAYFETLEAAGNPNQGSLLGDALAPAKSDLMNAARRTQDGPEDVATTQGAGRQAGVKSENQGGNEGRAEGDGALSEIKGSGKYRDGSKWGRRYYTKKRTDGSFALVRESTDEDGTRIEHLRQDGTWAKGEPASTAAFGAHAEEYAPETFASEDLALEEAKRDIGETWGAVQGEGPTKSEWVRFPAETGTLGIPRSEMPQIKGEHRGALIQFLQGRGITHETVDMPADQLKPTQAEFSTKKVQGWAEKREGVDRSVLASSDGYILDGHHQWVSALAAGETEKVIRFNVPIRELIAAVKEFPSVQQSEGSGDARAEKIDRLWNEALGDLGVIMRNVAGVQRMLPEDTPNLMPTLVKLFQAGIGKVGMNMADLLRYVKDALKKTEQFKTSWNKISPDTYRKAAQQAIDTYEEPAADGQMGLFSEPKAPKQGGFDFVQAEKQTKPDAAKVEASGQPWEERRKDNFKPPALEDIVPADVSQRVGALVEKWKDNLPEAKITDEERAKAEALLKPVMDATVKDEPWFDARVRKIGKLFLGSQLGPTKKIGRTAIKLVEEEYNVNEMKDIVRATIVVNSYDDAQAALDAIVQQFKVIQINNKTDLDIAAPEGAKLKNKGVSPEGYSDVTAFVRLPGGGIAELQINIPEMLSAKLSAHVLYEGSRVVEDDPARQDEYIELRDGQRDAYQAVLASALTRLASDTDRMKYASSELQPSETGAPLSGTSATDSSSKRNQLPSGNLTNSSPPNEDANRQPDGNFSGTFMGGSPSTDSIASGEAVSYTGSNQGGQDDNGKSGTGNTQGEGAGPASSTGGKRGTGSVRPGKGGADSGASRVDDASPADQGALGQAGTDGVRGQDEDGRRDQPGNRTRGDAGLPAGRDIPLKSGRNYVFGPDDLTYQGSWQKKATQNVEAVELLKQLQADGRQANREEQSRLAKFIGWGSSELANTLFDDKKLSEARKAAEAYQIAEKAMKESGRDYLESSGYRPNEYGRSSYQQGDPNFMDAFKVIQYAEPSAQYYGYPKITRAQLESAKPKPETMRWIDLQDRLKAVMTESEWADASRSTQYAHYTSKPIVQAMWQAMDHFGFKGGAVLEPGAGIGVFPGLMSPAMALNSVYTGIEFDQITGGILQQLFPDERILVESFIDSNLPENFYDVAAGNPPFGDIAILSDPKYKKYAFLLHDYFFAKTLDSVKPGGVVAFISSNGTMDKKGDKARAFMAERADLVGAVRLPNNAFMKNAGTEVVTDIIFLRKKAPGETFEQGQAWAKSVPLTVDGKQFSINEYFVAHPEMVMGNHSATGSMYGKDSYTVTPTAGGDLAENVTAAIQSLPKDIIVAARGSSAEAAKVREIDFNPKAQKEGNYYVTDAGVLMQREGGFGVRAELKNQKDAELIKDFIALRDAVKQAHYDQLNDGAWQESLTTLQKAYKAFTKKNGQINQYTLYMQKVKVAELDDQGNPTGEKVWDEEQRYRFPLLSKIQDDPDYTLVAALETFNEETGEIKESNFLTDRVLNKPKTANIKTPHDALLSVLNDTGTVDIGIIADRMAMTEREVIDALGSAVYQDPEAGWVMADEYLSGNVKKKLKKAIAAAKSDKRFERNVEALREAQPRARNAAEITAQIGMAWIPEQVYEQFLMEKAGVKASVIRNERTGQWLVRPVSGNKTQQSVTDWGTSSRSADEILQHALTGTPIRITKTEGSGKDKKTVFDADATEAAIEKLAQMRKAFAEWLWQDSGRINQLVPIYNDKFNNLVARKFDGRHLTMPGSTSTISVFDHVKRGAWRIVQQGNAYLAHAVGSGKTFQMVISAMEQKRLGLINKPMMVVPNHMLQQFAREWMQLYPAARLMVADEKGFHTDNRRRWVSRVAMSDLDGVIITHSAFKKLDMDPAFKQKMINEELDFLRAALQEAEDAADTGKRDFKVKQIEKRIERLEEKLKDAMSGVGKDKNVRFDEMGVDMLYVDEAHNFRKLDFVTTRSVKGIDPEGSDMSRDLWIKTRWLAEKNPNRYLVMASGTPVTNTMAELYTVQRFMANGALEEAGLERFDDWSAMYGQETSSLEPNAVGGYETQTRFNKFVNVGELTAAFREFADVLTGDHLAALLGDHRPKVKDGGRKMVLVPKPDVYSSFLQQELAERLKASKAWKPSKEQPGNPDPIMTINNDGSLSAIDLRFMEPSLPSDPNSKLNRMIDEVIRIHKETADWEYFADKAKTTKEPAKGATQMVFADVGFGEGVTQRRGFSARAWMEKRLRDAGIPLSEVAFMSDYKKSDAKLKLFRDVNAGRVRILVGSSKNMGTGVNAQQRLIALHHLDAPWYPADLEQREGRIIRQGNKNAWNKTPVEIYAYAMKGTYDEQRWGTLARKQVFIDQALSGDADVRDIEDLSESSEFDKAAAMIAEDPRLMQASGLRAEIEKLERLFRNHEESRTRANESYRFAGLTIETNEKTLPEAEKNAEKVQDLSGDLFTAKVGSKAFDSRKDWGEALLAKFKALADASDEKKQQIGEISGFKIMYAGERRDLTDFRAEIGVRLPDSFMVLAQDMTPDPVGMAMRATNALVALARKPEDMRRYIAEAKDKRAALESRLNAPFQFAQTLADRRTELGKLEEDIEKNAAAQSDWRLTHAETGEAIVVKAKSELEAKLKVIPWRRYSMDELGKWRATEIDENGKPIHRRLFGIEFLNATTMFSRASTASTGRMPVEKLQVVADRITKSMKNMPKVNVFESPDSAGVPGKLSALINKQGALKDVEGVLHDGEIYLFASGLVDEARAEQVLAEHEVTHYGLRGILGDDRKGTLQYIWANNNTVRKAATELAKKNGISHIEATEEVMADMKAKDLVGVKGWRRLVLKVRDWLGEHGFKALSDRLTEFLNGTMDAQAQADLIVADLVRRAREFVRNGPPMSGGMMGNMAGTMLSRAKPASDRANDIIAKKSGTPRPLDAVMKGATQAVRLDKVTGAIYDKAGFFLDRFTPEHIKAGLVADYGIPEAVLDQRATMSGRMRVQLRKTGELIDTLATLTREESRIAYQWMNSDDPQSSDYLMEQLPPESIKTMAEVERMIDKLSQEAVALKQLDPETFKRNRFAYLRRSYVKHTAELTKGEQTKRARAISILGDQYKGRGMTEGVEMKRIQNVAPEWWKRKLQAGKADKGLKGEKFIRLEKRANTGAGTVPLAGMTGRPDGKLLAVAYWPAGEPIPARLKDWNEMGTWEVRDTKGDKLVMWRDFTAQERQTMGEIDEARYAIAKTLHGMIHDVEVGNYLEWLAHHYGKKDGSGLNVVEASERMRDTFGQDEWVQVPDTKIQGTNTLKYGLLAGRYLPGPIWNDVRQVTAGQFRPLGDTYAAILRAWKTSKTVLSPGVHTNNIMANMVMADWHDVSAGHMLKALRLMLGASDRDGKMVIGRAGNLASRAGVADREAAKKIIDRFQDSGGNIGTWATAELQREQLEPLLEALEKEIATGAPQSAEVGVMAALQHAMHLRFPSAFAALAPTKVGKAVVTEGKNMIALYEAEDQVFRLAAWLKAKEDGLNDLDAGKVARKSFLDYNINAPWIQMVRQTALPFIAFTYRAAPMLIETAAKKPWKLMKLGLMVGALNALGYALSGGDEDDERKLLPEEKAGSIWGMVPKLVRMPWNDANGEPVFLDIRRWVPVGDVFDLGQNHAAIPVIPAAVPGGPLALFAELMMNKSQFTGKPITKETDTGTEKASAVLDHLYKAFAPNIVALPGTYAFTGVMNAGGGRTDSFGREQSLAQAIATAHGVKLGSYPKDQLMLNESRAMQSKLMEIKGNITTLKREYARKGINAEEFKEGLDAQMEKQRKVLEDYREKVN